MDYKRFLFSTTSAVALSFVGAGLAHAQELGTIVAQAADPNSNGSSVSASPTSPTSNVEQVVVTGSRIARTSGYESATPLTTVSAEALELTSPGTVTDALNELPEFRGSSRPDTGGLSANTTVGASLLNLRNLAPQRTLILFDGQRVVPTTTAGVADINTLPQELIQRVDVVTGGASAAYGSDAVAGVVNFVLDKDFTGVKGEVQGGISTYGDSGSEKAGVAFGTNVGEQLHIVGSVDFYHIDGIGPYEGLNRPWRSANAGLIPNVPATAQPTELIVPSGVTVSDANFGGLITGGPFKGTTFTPSGTPTPFQYGTTVGSVFQIGGSGDQHMPNLTAGLERESVFTHAEYDISNDWSVFAEGNWSQSVGKWGQYYNWLEGTQGLTIFSGNPFIPASLQAQMTAGGIASFPLGQLIADQGSASLIRAVSDGTMWRGAAGFKGRVDDWDLSGYYTHGESGTKITNSNVLNFQHVYAAADAVTDPATGNTVCQVTLTQPNNYPGCVPYNPFGQGSASAAAMNYILGDEARDLRYIQDVVALNVQRKLGNLWSNQPIAVAAGFEYRAESANQTVSGANGAPNAVINLTGVRGAPPSLQGALGDFIVGNPQPLGGSFNVEEGYFETDIPVVEDIPWVKLLDIDAADRVTNYNLSGVVDTWKVSVSYKPTDDLRLRGTRSHDIRAPNVSELFSGSVQSTGTIHDLVSGATIQFTGDTVGNPKLQPEIADTITAGVVYEPTWLPGLSASVDYYSIKIEGAIASLGAQGTLNACDQGSAVACSEIQSIGGADRITIPELNLQSLSVDGFDIESSYHFDLFEGQGLLHLLANYQPKNLQSTPGALPVENAGVVGASSNPLWQASLSATYKLDEYTGFIQERFISAGIYNSTLVQGVSINNNSIPAVFYTDITLSRQIGDIFEVYGSISNLFDKAPPLAATATISVSNYTNNSLYDTIGRYFSVGVRFHF